MIDEGLKYVIFFSYVRYENLQLQQHEAQRKFITFNCTCKVICGAIDRISTKMQQF